MTFNDVFQSRRRRRDRCFELGVLERERTPAPGAEQVMMVLHATRKRRLKSRWVAPAHVETLNEAELVEGFQRPVDRRDRDRAATGAQLVSDLVRGENALLAAEQLKHRRPRSARAVAGTAQLALGELDPRGGPRPGPARRLRSTPRGR
jgi:hypothetical protein